MKKANALLALFMVLCMVFAAGCGAPATDTEPTVVPTEAPVAAPVAALYTPGVYTAVAKGNNGDITVEVTFTAETIASVVVKEHAETDGLGTPAMDTIAAKIVDKQSLAIDTVSGATNSSKAVLAAVEDCVAQAGGDVAALKAATEAETAQTTAEVVKETFDVVVVGSGAAGLTTATTVIENGGSVVIIEKMPNIGGTTAVSGGTLNAVDPDRQVPLGIEDSVDLFVQNVYEGGGELGDLDLIRVMCDQACDARYWIESYGGKWKDVVYQTFGGLFPRSVDAEVNTKGTIVDPLTSFLEGQEKAEIILNMKATELIIENGRVVGVRAENTETGNPYEFYGTNGVVLATGGYARNIELVREFCPVIPEDIVINPPVCATGDGITMARAIGANLVGMEYVQMVPGALIYPDGSKGLSVHGSMENCIIVNKDGVRVVSEYGTRKELCDTCVAQEDSHLYFLFDGNTLTDDFVSQIDPGYTIADYKAAAEKGLCGYGDTIEEACATFDLDPEAVKQTIEEYNQMVRGETTDPFGRDSFEQEFGKGPFVISIRAAKLHYTMGGVQIDTDTHVIDTNGNVISGLYAVGEVTGGIHGNNRVGGNALAECVVFGRIAGANAMLKK